MRVRGGVGARRAKRDTRAHNHISARANQKNAQPESMDSDEESFAEMAHDGSATGKGDGNTNPPSRVAPRNTACKLWFFTWNNYDLLQFETWFRSLKCGATRRKYLKAVCQEETGEEGTPHIQGYLEFRDKVRPMEAKWINLPKQVHWEKVRNQQAALEYCCKLESRTGRTYTLNYEIQDELDILYPEDLFDWQREIVSYIKQKPDPRKIYWCWSPEGGRGKTTFSKYLETMYDACKITGNRANVVRMIANWQETKGGTPKLVILDLPKNQEDFVSYAGMEDIKNMSFVSTKFECINVLGNSPHLIVFANHPPEEERMTNNRFIIKKI